MKSNQANVGERLKNDVTLKPLLANHPYAWRATFIENGARKQKYFKTKVAATEFRKGRETETAISGTAAQLSSIERSAVIDSRAALEKAGLSLRSAIDYALDHHRKAGESVTVSVMSAEVLEAKGREKRSKRHIDSLKSRLGKFEEAFGSRIISTITSKEVEDWIHGLDVADITKNNYRRDLSVMFSRAVSRGYAERNVIASIEVVKVIKDDEIGILTPNEAARLVAVADERILPAISIGLFAGLRDEELHRLEWDAFTFKKSDAMPHGYLNVGSKVAKRNRKRMIPLSKNLKAILKPLAKKGGKIWPTNGRRIREASRNVAGFGTPANIAKAKKKDVTLKPWPKNALRHSFASYHLAYHKDASALALLMGHTDTKIIFDSYREPVAPEAAATYWSIGVNDDAKIVDFAARA